MEILSTKWRLNKSEIPAIELANAIRALSKVVGHLEHTTQLIRFSGGAFSTSSVGLITIDPTFAVKGFPIVPNHFDVLVGLAAHEATHTVAESHLAGSMDYKGVYTDRIAPSTIAAVGEEIYVDGLLRRTQPVLHKYLLKSREAYRGDPDWSKILPAWVSVALYGQLPSDSISGRVLEALSILMEYTRQLSTQDLDPYRRNKVYVEIHAKLLHLIVEEILRGKKPQDVHPEEGEWKGLPYNTAYDADDAETEQEKERSKDQDSNEDDGIDPDTNGDQEEQPNPTLPPELLTSLSPSCGSLLPTHTPNQLTPELINEVEAALESDIEDLTEAVLEILPATDMKGAVVWKNSTNKPDTTFSEHLYRDLIWLRLLKNTVGRQTYRGELQGTLDQTHLYRASIDERPFKVTRRVPKQDLKVVLLLDSSSSMVSRTEVYNCAKAVYKVMPEIDVISYAYNPRGVEIEVHSIKKGPFRSIHPTGSTPSGIALLATAMKFPNSLIIHFTDGESNVGPGPSTVFPIIEREYPKVQIVDVRFRPGVTYSRRDPRAAPPAPPPPNTKIISLFDIADFGRLLRQELLPWTRVRSS